MSENQNETGFFEGVLTFVGVISGAIFGYNNGEWLGLFLGALIFGVVGNRVGALADWTVKLVLLIVLLLINGAIRRFIFEIFASVFQQ